MSLNDFFSPVSTDSIKPHSGYVNGSIASQIQTYIHRFPDLEDIHLVLIGVEEDRHAINNKGCAFAADAVRPYFYKLFRGPFELKMADLGNIKAGASVRDTYVALKTVVAELLKKNIVPIIMGGGQDLSYAQYWAYEELEQRVDLVVLDALFDIDAQKEENALPGSHSYLNKIILHEPNFLFNYSNIGYQTYLVNQENIRLMDKLYFDVHRLGEISGNVKLSEPIIRNADLLSVDISVIRQSDAPGTRNANPNGFYGEEMCQMMRYAGMSDKLSSIGLYEMNPEADRMGQTAALCAQMIWCFIDGYYARKKDLPNTNKKDFIKYRATFKDGLHEVVFYKSKRTDRWWMQIPYPNNRTKNERFHLVPCSYEDYKTACSGEMPDRWWKSFQKLI